MDSNHQTGKIVGFCCNYTATVLPETLRESGLIPEDLEIRKLACTGRIEIPALLDAFTDGAEAVFVAGCQPNECHNLSGSRRAEKRVKYTKEILKELDIDPNRLEMFFVNRAETEPIIEAVREMMGRISRLGQLMPSRPGD
ncbi:MAG: hydrogenase iron-sulfur subunit [Nitrospiraceae bacterium]|nr:hydrogenase iron-sulfur subunit [Nitrospiraceae bacterium]